MNVARIRLFCLQPCNPACNLAVSLNVVHQNLTNQQIHLVMRTKSCFFALALLLTASFSVFGQREETLFGSHGWGFSGIWGGVSWDYTSYNKHDGYNQRGYFGFEFGRALNVGWSHFRLIDDVPFNQGGEFQRLDFNFNGGFLGYSFMPYKAIHPMLNLEMGQGRVAIYTPLTTTRDNTFTVQPSAGVEINVFQWFRLGLEGGYRFVSDVEYAGLTNQNLSAPFGRATLKFGFSWGRFCKKTDYRKSYED
jgi:hypothetical protein